MAITVEGTYTSTSVKTTISYINSVVVPSESNRILYVFISQHQKSANAGKYATGVVWDPITIQESLELVGTEEYNEEVVSIWRKVAPTAGTSSIEITWVDNNANWDGSCHAAVVFSGVDQTTPDDGWNSSSGTGLVSQLIFASTSGDLAYWVNSFDDIDPGAPGGGPASQWDLVNDQNYGNGASIVSDGGLKSCNWTVGSAADYAIAGVSLNPYIEAGPFNVLQGKLINRKINPYINERIN